MNLLLAKELVSDQNIYNSSLDFEKPFFYGALVGKIKTVNVEMSLGA